MAWFGGALVGVVEFKGLKSDPGISHIVDINVRQKDEHSLLECLGTQNKTCVDLNEYESNRQVFWLIFCSSWHIKNYLFTIKVKL